MRDGKKLGVSSIFHMERKQPMMDMPIHNVPSKCIRACMHAYKNKVKCIAHLTLTFRLVRTFIINFFTAADDEDTPADDALAEAFATAVGAGVGVGVGVGVGAAAVAAAALAPPPPPPPPLLHNNVQGRTVPNPQTHGSCT